MKVSHNWTRKGEAWQRIKGQWWLIQIVLLQAKVSICCYGKTWMNFLAYPISQRHDVEFKKQKYVNEGNWVLGMWSKSFTYINPMFTSFHLPLVNWFRNPAGLTVSWYSKCLIIIQNNRGKVLPGFGPMPFTELVADFSTDYNNISDVYLVPSKAWVYFWTLCSVPVIKLSIPNIPLF